MDMSNLRLRVSVAALVLACAIPASAQPAAKPQGSQPAAPAATSGAPAAPLPVEQAPYSYDPQSRRDPFVSLLARGSDPRGAATRAAGLPGVLIAEASVKGIVRDRSGFIAMIQGTGT